MRLPIALASIDEQIEQELDLTFLRSTRKVSLFPVKIVQVWDDLRSECGMGECGAPLPFSYEPVVQFFTPLTSIHPHVVLDNNLGGEEAFGLYHIPIAPTYVKPPEYATLFPSSDEQGKDLDVAPLPSLERPNCLPL